MDRLNLDHTFSPTLLNNFNIGYSDYRGIGQCNDSPYTSDLPMIPGVANHAPSTPNCLSGLHQFWLQ